MKITWKNEDNDEEEKEAIRAMTRRGSYIFGDLMNDLILTTNYNPKKHDAEIIINGAIYTFGELMKKTLFGFVGCDTIHVNYKTKKLSMMY